MFFFGVRIVVSGVAVKSESCSEPYSLRQPFVVIGEEDVSQAHHRKHAFLWRQPAHLMFAANRGGPILNQQVQKERKAMSATRDQDVLQMLAGSTQESARSSANGDTRVILAAHRLAVAFADEADLPARFRKSSPSAQSRKTKKDSEVEKRFRANVKSWTQLIETMLAKLSSQQAWRFVELSPETDPTLRKLSDCKDFCDFMDYLSLRRDREKCSADELGGLAMLSTTFQREIEKSIPSLLTGRTPEPAAPTDA